MTSPLWVQSSYPVGGMTPGERLADPDSWPFAVAVKGQVYWRGRGGQAFVYWPTPQAEILADRFAARGWSDLVEPLRAAIQAAESYTPEEEIAA